MFWQLGFILATASQAEKTSKDGICFNTKNEKCEKEYHYCHLMFGGECWITKIVTVLTDCEVKVETCCDGWLKDENGDGETKKGLNCIRKSGCGGKSILREQNGVVQSLNYPQKYNSSLDCSWTIEAPKNHKIQLAFIGIEIEDSSGCRFDRLQVKDAKSERVICGKRDPVTILSTTNVLELNFKSDAHVNYQGFKANYSFVSDDSLATACDGEEIWSPCHGCEISCDELECSGVDRKCEPGCFCPPHKPIRHQGQCITFEQCPANQIQPKCGTSVESKISTRIMGGETSSDKEWPWATQLLRYNELICGATLIASNWLLTAAHCFIENTYINLEMENYLIILGSAKRPHSISDPFIKMLVPELAFPHPRFSFNTNSHDIALIGLPESVLYSNYIRPACLPRPQSAGPKINDSCTVIGWGKTQSDHSDDQLSSILRKADLSIENHDVCHNMYLIYNPITQMCLKGEMVENTCEGDSGGPLLCESSGENGSGPSWTIDGITSFGTSCGEGKPVGVYTRVQFYISWIESICGSNCQLSVKDLLTKTDEIIGPEADAKAHLKMASGSIITPKKTKRQINYEYRRSQRQKERQKRIEAKATLRARRVKERQAKRASKRAKRS